MGGLQAPSGWEYGWNSWGPFDALLNSEKAHTLSSSYLLKVLWKDLMTKTEELTLVSTASLLFSCSTSFHLGPLFIVFSFKMLNLLQPYFGLYVIAVPKNTIPSVMLNFVSLTGLRNA